jgi:predicted metalloprotease with PDZ domain
MSTEAETELVPEPVRDTTLALKRETILPSSDRGRLAAIVATCSLAGLAGGMALSMLAETHRAVEATRVSEVARLSREPMTWLGVRSSDVSPHDCAGARVSEVTPGSPAARAGFQSGDVIVSFGGDRVCGTEGLIDVVSASQIGATPEMHVRRGTVDLVVHPALAPMPDAIKADVVMQRARR